MSMRVVDVSTRATLRRRLSRTSLLRQTLHWHPSEGTPPEVPVPKNVTLISLMCLYDVDFRLYRNAELAFDVGTYHVAQAKDFVSRSPSPIDENESLTGVNSCPADGLAFPSALLNEPSGWNII